MTTTTSVPTLPVELLGEPVVWADWDIAPVMSHVPFDCTICAYADPPAVALGRGAATFFAVRCRHCQTTREDYRRRWPEATGHLVRRLVTHGPVEAVGDDGSGT